MGGGVGGGEGGGGGRQGGGGGGRQAGRGGGWGAVCFRVASCCSAVPAVPHGGQHHSDCMQCSTAAVCMASPPIIINPPNPPHVSASAAAPCAGGQQRVQEPAASGRGGRQPARLQVGLRLRRVAPRMRGGWGWVGWVGGGVGSSAAMAWQQVAATLRGSVPCLVWFRCKSALLTTYRTRSFAAHHDRSRQDCSRHCARRAPARASRPARAPTVSCVTTWAKGCASTWACRRPSAACASRRGITS